MLLGTEGISEYLPIFRGKNSTRDQHPGAAIVSEEAREPG